MTVEPDLQIRMQLVEGGYNVTYTTPAGVHREVQHLTRPEMVEAHVAAMQEVQPRTVVVVSEDGSTTLHPGAVKAIVEGKLGPRELTLGE